MMDPIPRPQFDVDVDVGFEPVEQVATVWAPTISPMPPNMCIRNRNVVVNIFIKTV